MKKFLTLGALVLLLSGCAGMESRTVSVQELSDDSLCKLATYPYMNRESARDAALTELKRRKRSCDWPAYARYHIARQMYASRPFYIHRYFWPRFGWRRPHHHHGPYYAHVHGRRVACSPTGNYMRCGGR